MSQERVYYACTKETAPLNNSYLLSKDATLDFVTQLPHVINGYMLIVK